MSVPVADHDLPATPLICAIDTQEPARARALMDAVSPHVGAVKLGLEAFTAFGPQGLRDLMPDGLPLFLDLKFHDIPHTVARAVEAAAALRPCLLTVHASGGQAMLEAAVAAAARVPRFAWPRPRVLAVTALTSLEGPDLKATGITRPLVEHVRALAALAERAGCDGVVCSAREVAMLRAERSRDFLLVTPGIRPDPDQKQDQQRVMTPKAALVAGADYLVVGRPITNAADPARAARSLKLSIADLT